MKNVSFPRTYTTAGAVYRAKKTFSERFPEKTFMVVKEDGGYVLDVIGSSTPEMVTETTEEATEESEPSRSRGKNKVRIGQDEFHSTATYIDLDETKVPTIDDLFDEDDDYYVEPFGWED